MLIDLHAHTGAISSCCRADSETILKTAKEYGFDGLAVTNHYMSYYFTEKTYDTWIEAYIAEWENCVRLGEKLGLRIFRGIEITLDCDPNLHMLVYGADADFLRNNSYLNRRPQKELYELCKQNGYAFVQAHPFRNGATVQDTNYLDGIEINCHPIYQNSYADKLIKTAKENNLALTAGCDYHADSYRPKGGVFLPDDVKTDSELANYILTSKSFELQIHEPLDNSIYKYSFSR